MKVKKIIPCLDFKNGRVVKGEKFTNLKDAGDPVKLARQYAETGADELVFLDISATNESRGTVLGYVEEISKVSSIPLTVGGGIRDLRDIEAVLAKGATKVAINSAAVKNPELIDQAAKEFGSDKIVVAIDVVKANNSWLVVTHGGNLVTKLDAIEWAKEVEKRRFTWKTIIISC